MKKIKEIQEQYTSDYQDIPRDSEARLQYLIKEFNISDKLQEEAQVIKQSIFQDMVYDEYTIILYEEPVGKPRPRFKRIRGKNQVYSGNEYYKKKAFKEILTQEDLDQFKNKLISTPCTISYNAYLKTPSTFNKLDTLLAEIGVIRPLNKPDWDNIGKEYSDLFNELVWIDDIVVISATVNKFYSILPRIEITFYVANAFYNKYQFNLMKKKQPDRTFSYFQKGLLMKG